MNKETNLKSNLIGGQEDSLSGTLGLNGVGRGSRRAPRSGLIKCGIKRRPGGKEVVLKVGNPCLGDDVFPPSALSDKLISQSDSEVLQPLSAGSRLLPSHGTAAHRTDSVPR